MLGVLWVRGRRVAYLLAPVFDDDTVSSEEVLIPETGTRAKKGTLRVHHLDGTTKRVRIAWDAPKGPGTAKGEYDIL